MPIILVSKSQPKIDLYLAKYIKDHSIGPFDIYIFEPEKRDMGIDQIREIKKLIVTESANRRLIIINGFDSATAEAQNATLKTLEEKTRNNQFMITAQSTERILPTIRSRSQTVLLDERQGAVLNREYQSLFNNIVREEKLTFLADPLLQGITRDAAIGLIDESLIYLMSLLSTSASAVDVMKKAFQIKLLLQSNNLNPQLSIDSYLIFFKKKLQAAK